MRRLAGLAIVICFLFLPAALVAQAGPKIIAPKYKVDPWWPKELPFNWVLGTINGVAIGPDNSIWVLHEPRLVPRDDAAAAQNPPWTPCCIPAPEVLQFSPDGKVLRAWSGRGRIPAWPAAAHGISVDKAGNVWIGGVGKPWHPDLPGFTMKQSGDAAKTEGASRDRQVLKLNQDGKLLLQIGQPSIASFDNKDTSILGAPTAVAVDDGAKDVYIADGLDNKRVVVFDSETGAFKRGWGAYGIPLSEIDNTDPDASELPTGKPRDASASPAKQFRVVSDIEVSTDGFVYVADQKNNRIQVFSRQGKFEREFFVAPKTLGNGSVWGLSLSPDAKQQYLLVADGSAGVIRILDRQSGEEIGRVGSKGRNAGQFITPAFAPADSQGVLYTGEVHFDRSWDGWQATHTGVADTPGGRLQKFVIDQ